MSARQRLAALQRAAHDSDALHRSTLDAIRQLESARALLINRRDSADTPAKAEAAVAELDANEAEIDRLKALRNQRQERAANDHRVATQAAAYLQRRPDAAAVEQSGGNGFDEDLDSTLTHVRHAIAAKQSELAAVRRAPEPVADVQDRARRLVDQLAERGRPRLTVTGRGLTVAWRSRQDATSTGMTAEDVAAFMAWLFSDRLKNALAAEVEAALPIHAEAIPAAERDRRIAELSAEILDLERREESIIVASLASSRDAIRRPDADPRALLGVV